MSPKLSVFAFCLTSALAANALATLRQWIAEGAPYEKHWAFYFLQPNATPDIGALVVKGLVGRGIARQA